MTPEQLTAVAGLAGVAIGAGGALLGSRMQSKAADRSAAVAAKAALEGVHAQVTTTKQVEVQTARRAAYGTFLKEANELHQQLDAVALDSTATAQAVKRVETALAFVALEGPDGVSESAWTVLTAGSEGLGIYENSRDIEATWDRLGAYRELLRLELNRLCYVLADEEMSELWRPTAEWWAFTCAIGGGEEVEFPDVPLYREWNRMNVAAWSDQEREDMRRTGQYSVGPISVRRDSSTPTHLVMIMVREQRHTVDFEKIRDLARSVLSMVESARRDFEQRRSGLELSDSEISALILFAIQGRGVTPRMAVDDASTELHDEIRTFTALARQALYAGAPGQ